MRCSPWLETLVAQVKFLRQESGTGKPDQPPTAGTAANSLQRWSGQAQKPTQEERQEKRRAKKGHSGRTLGDDSDTGLPTYIPFPDAPPYHRARLIKSAITAILTTKYPTREAGKPRPLRLALEMALGVFQSQESALTTAPCPGSEQDYCYIRKNAPLLKKSWIADQRTCLPAVRRRNAYNGEKTRDELKICKQRKDVVL